MQDSRKNYPAQVLSYYILEARLVFFLLFRLRCISNRVDDGCHEERADHIDHGVLL